MEKKTERVFLIDFLNVISCFGVVWLHVNGAVWTFSYFRTWVTSWLLETLLYWPVPIFFMLSGITLLGYRDRYNMKVFLKKRMMKTLLPFLFWSVVSIFWSIYVSGYLTPDTRISLLSMVDLVVNCKGMSIYWFFPALFSVYLSIPILSLVEKEKRFGIYTYILVYGVLTISILPFLAALFGISFNSDLKSPICGGYLMYLLLGYLLWNHELTKRQRYIVYILGIAGWAVRFFGGWYLSWQAGNVNSTFSGYLNVPCVAQSAAVFVFFRQCDFTSLKKKMGSVVANLSELSFGIYLVHFYLMRFVIDQFQIEMSSWQWRLGGVWFTYFCSAGIVACMKKVPALSWLVP